MPVKGYFLMRFFLIDYLILTGKQPILNDTFL